MYCKKTKRSKDSVIVPVGETTKNLKHLNVFKLPKLRALPQATAILDSVFLLNFTGVGWGRGWEVDLKLKKNPRCNTLKSTSFFSGGAVGRCWIDLI